MEDKTTYSPEKVNSIKDRVKQLMKIVNDLEKDFPGRSFTLDGHLVGSIGEVIAASCYAVKLSKPSEKTHDGVVDGKKVQIKITQQNNIMISSKPEHLLVLYLNNESGEVYEVYNGPGDLVWDSKKNLDSHNYKHFSLGKLMKLDKNVKLDERLKSNPKIKKMQNEYKNKKDKDIRTF